MTKEKIYEIMGIEEGTIAYDNAEHMINVEGFTPEMLLKAYNNMGVFWQFVQKEDVEDK